MNLLQGYLHYLLYLLVSFLYILFLFYVGRSGLGRCENGMEISRFKEDWGFRVYEGEDNRF